MSGLNLRYEVDFGQNNSMVLRVEQDVGVAISIPGHC